MYNFFYYSSIPFDFYIQRPQHISFELARSGYCNVHYHSFPLSITYKLKKNKQLENSKPFYHKNLIIHTFYTLPRSLQSLIWPIALKIQKYQIMQSTKGKKHKIAFIGHPEWLQFLDLSVFDYIIYDVFDDLSVINAKNRIIEFHNFLIKIADLVCVTRNENLLNSVKKIRQHKPILELSNGVDVSLFRKNANILDSTIEDIPIIGFIGAIYDWIDIELIVACAKLRPHYKFIIAGGMSQKIENYLMKIDIPSNLFFPGRIPKEDVPSLLSKFTIGIIPFLENEISSTTDPIKLYEYFAIGLPVVSTPLPSLEKFAKDNLLTIAKNIHEFLLGLDKFSYEDELSHLKDERRRYAESYSWENLVNK